jgi:hypothetical protein
MDGSAEDFKTVVSTGFSLKNLQREALEIHISFQVA